MFKKLNLGHRKSKRETAANLTYYRPKSNQICTAPSLTDSTNINLALTKSPWTHWTPKVSPDSLHLCLPTHKALNHALSSQFQKQLQVGYHIPNIKNSSRHGIIVVLHFPCSTALLNYSDLWELLLGRIVTNRSVYPAQCQPQSECPRGMWSSVICLLLVKSSRYRGIKPYAGGHSHNNDKVRCRE